jgi:hypothetical protein
MRVYFPVCPKDVLPVKIDWTWEPFLSILQSSEVTICTYGQEIDSKLKYASLEGLCLNIFVGDILEMKKEHPCGSRQWKVLRVGMDFRLRCEGCQHEVMLPRKKVETSIKRIVLSGASQQTDHE